jgi:hypothetical protein
MITTGRLTRDDFELAITRSKEVGGSQRLQGLASPEDNVFWGKVDMVWNAVTNALRRAYVLGKDAAREAMDSAKAQAQALIAEAGARAREIHDALLDKVQAYLTTVIDSAIRQVRGQLVLTGGRSLELSGVEVRQRLSLSGEIGVTLESLFSLTSEGEVEVAAHYGQTPA